ncbi:zinc-dependent alcohol dehydrogenase [Geodermatophilus ruber]|uniref:zinc-dependent alcohol dehydrogenase n=1 Tax=Geodermatophilus ruber TaxID=504800 RepID=UPI0015A624DF|nr:zinc-binding alcohol dehydrogenase [Geodermatophilus ruber]
MRGLSARRLLFLAPRRVGLAPVDLPEPGPGRLVVRTRFSGISTGTELLCYRGLLDPDLPLDERLGALGGSFRYPFPYGYSCVGEVELGTAAVPAGTTVFAFHPHQDRFVVAEDDVVVLPEGTDPRAATLFPLVETALQLSLDAGQVAHETVAVLGLGAVGVLTALLLQRAGATVLAADPLEERRELAGALGLPAVAPEDLLAGLPPGGVPLVVELSGSPAALAGALPLLAHEGTVLVGSWYGEQPVALPLGGAFHRRRLTLRSSQVSTVPARLGDRWDIPRRRRAAGALLGELPLAALATTEFDFEEAALAYAALDGREPGVLHVALRYP